MGDETFIEKWKRNYSRDENSLSNKKNRGETNLPIYLTGNIITCWTLVVVSDVPCVPGHRKAGGENG